MSEHKPFEDDTAVNPADIALGKKDYPPNSISLFVCAAFVQINLYAFITPLLDITSANLTYLEAG